MFWAAGGLGLRIVGGPFSVRPLACGHDVAACYADEQEHATTALGNLNEKVHKLLRVKFRP